MEREALPTNAREASAEEHHMTRIPWGPEGLPVIAQSFWGPELQRMGKQFELTSGQCLHWHPDYEQAKKGGSLEAAARAIMSVINTKRLADLQQKIAGREVIFLAPLVPPANGGRNMLPISFARFLARHFGGKVAEDVRQVVRVGRKDMDGIDKLLHQPSFAGSIKQGAHYVLVDDSSKDGGTGATLRSFVEERGGKVICMATLANCAGSLRSLHTNTPGTRELMGLLKHNIAATPAQIETLQKKVGPHADRILEKYCHFGMAALTATEARVAGEYGHNLREVLQRRCATTQPTPQNSNLH
ncbi:MAG: phosphoribosyltransferase [Micavibrio aeruginosavorus]|uniref:Phosphoribosyltransferase n=1 Tax=Micavibrio aeruginosavorus TaxID=349221 RepID=A0A7T5R2I4_9BACT|nr:MAG: phosphoribosyltransferase [Micavibrio aeruginosavorus]